MFVVFKFKNFITYVFLSTTLVASKHKLECLQDEKGKWYIQDIPLKED